MFVVLEGFGLVTQVGIDQAHIGEGGGLPAPVAHLPTKGQSLFVVLEGFGFIAQGGIDQAHIVEGGGLPAPVAQFPADY